MKTYHLFRALPALLIATASADTFEMKDGTKLEGVILREEGSNYVLSVQITKSIKDEKVVAKSDVLKHVKERKDETEFEALATLVPTPDLKSAEAYASDIAKVENFLKKYPTSAKKAQAAKILDTLVGEHALVKDGGVKLDGKMISASDRAPNAYGLDAGILAKQFTTAAEKNDYLNALRAWSKLEAGYPGSNIYRENIQTALKVMRAYQMLVNTTLAGFDARTKERAAGLAGMNPGDRIRSEQAIKEQQDLYLARVDKEKTDGLKWLSLDPYVKLPLDETKRYLDTETRRLENLDLTYIPKTQEVYEETYKAVTKSGATKQEIDAALSKARGVSMPQQYIDILTKAAPATPTP